MRRHAPATDRNRDPILAVLSDVLPDEGRVLEIAAGTGQHTAYFSAAFPNLSWLPTDGNPDSLASIGAWNADRPNVADARMLDVMVDSWGVDDEPLAAILCINMIHISPWEATEALMAGAGRHLKPGGVLYTYGPYRIDGAHTSESNVRFEGWLHSLDERFGVRDLADVTAAAAAHGLVFEQRVVMPANNFSLVFRRA